TAVVVHHVDRALVVVDIAAARPAGRRDVPDHRCRAVIHPARRCVVDDTTVVTAAAPVRTVIAAAVMVAAIVMATVMTGMPIVVALSMALPATMVVACHGRRRGEHRQGQHGNRSPFHRLVHASSAWWVIAVRGNDYPSTTLNDAGLQPFARTLLSTAFNDGSASPSCGLACTSQARSSTGHS